MNWPIQSLSEIGRLMQSISEGGVGPWLAATLPQASLMSLGQRHFCRQVSLGVGWPWHHQAIVTTDQCFLDTHWTGSANRTTPRQPNPHLFGWVDHLSCCRASPYGNLATINLLSDVCNQPIYVEKYSPRSSLIIAFTEPFIHEQFLKAGHGQTFFAVMLWLHDWIHQLVIIVSKFLYQN